tara:strand:- start:660 stop:1355 length:696 start_codon:yes stop_codon:yes gene_type:complete
VSLVRFLEAPFIKSSHFLRAFFNYKVLQFNFLIDAFKKNIILNINLLMFIINFITFTTQNSIKILVKDVKHILAIISIVVISCLNIKYQNSHTLIVVGGFLTVVLIFNYSIRKKIRYKSYFLNPWNFLVSAQFSNQNTEISSELMYEKMPELVRDLNYQVQNSNLLKKSIFITTPISFKSWGENIYIDIDETNSGKSIINITSASLQVYSWGKNKQNFDKLILEIEESLII